MNRWLNNASNVKRSRLAGACRILPCIFGADIGAQLGHNLNQFVTSAIGDRIGDEVLHLTPTFAAMSGGTLDPNSLASQLLPGLVGALFTLLLSLLWERRPRRAWPFGQIPQTASNDFLGNS